MTKKLLMGNEAIAHAALEAGVGVVAGYPGTPSSEIVETVARQHQRGAAHGVHVEWSTNEKVALELLFGASLAGKRGLFTCKQMGLNVASDALMSLNYVSVRAGLVLIVADDPGPISSQTEQDTRRFAAFAKVPVLDPDSPEQAFRMVKAAFDLSERFHTPVIVRPTTRVDHASAFIEVAEETTARTPLVAAPIPTPADDPAATSALPAGFVRDPSKWVIFPRRAYEAHGEINERLAEIAGVFSTHPTFAQFNHVTEVAATPGQRRAHAQSSVNGTDPGASLGIMASGISAAYAREALRMIAQRAAEAGVRMPAYRFMQVGTPFPFPEAAVAEFTKGLADVLVIEELDYVLEDELARFAGRTHAQFDVHGKLTGEARDRGENDVDDITARIERFLGLTGRLSLFRLREDTRYATFGEPGDGPLSVQLDEEDEAQLPARPPVLCAGCPHRGSFYAVKLALGDMPAVLCGDIGCYTLGNAAPLDAVDTCLCMGAGITMAQGIAAADPGKKAVAFIGDSTFFASGMTGLANAAYNGHDITVVVLDNATTAMTGSQPHPGTGVTLMGTRNEPISIEGVLAAMGFTRIRRANPLDRDASVAAARDAIAYEGPSAIIFQSPCAQLVPPDPPALVNVDTCTGCKRCITSIGCPAINFSAQANGPRSRGRGQAVIDKSLCVGCNLCVQVCPFKAIIPGEIAAEMGEAPAWPPYKGAAMPDPADFADEEADALQGSGPLAGMRASAEASAAADSFAQGARGKSGPFRPYPTFDNPWDVGKTDVFPPVDGPTADAEPAPAPVPAVGGGAPDQAPAPDFTFEGDAASGADFAPASAAGYEAGLAPETGFALADEPEPVSGDAPASVVEPLPASEPQPKPEPEPAPELALEFADDIPDFGIAAEFEEELRADEEESQREGQRNA